jgi:hypothetical protein
MDSKSSLLHKKNTDGGGSIQIRQFIELILKPLKDVILALQMNSKFFHEFVKTELISDFGSVFCVKVWQIIMCWRNEPKEEIVAVHDKIFKNWNPAPKQPPLVDVSYVAKLKNANIIK